MHNNSRRARLNRGCLESPTLLKGQNVNHLFSIVRGGDKGTAPCMASGGGPLPYHVISGDQKTPSKFIHSRASILGHGTQRELGQFSFVSWDYGPGTIESLGERDK